MIHTKEPWEIQKGNIGPYIMAKDGNGGTVAIAQVFQRGIANCETDGNARLLKAAPKMYEAIKSFQHLLNVKVEGIGQFAAMASVSFQKLSQALAEVEGKEGEDGS